MREGDVLDHFFLGPKGELRRFFKEVVELVVDDYIFWRRNYHPKDPPAIPYRLLQSEDAAEFRGRFHQELFELISDLKLDVPFFSPRYMAHMVSEVAMPGLVAYLATMLYNPNNVSLESSPVTVRYELEVGRQFATLFGYEPTTSFGHLCSGGTLANFESLWFHRAGRFLPLAISLACRHEGIEAPPGLPKKVWELLNLPMATTQRLFEDFNACCFEASKDATAVIRRWSLDAFGDADYRALVLETFYETYNSPVVLVPQTAHYSWRRSAGLLGFGRRNLRPVAVDSHFRMVPQEYDRQLRQCAEEKRPILQSVFVIGTTEFGSVDPVAQLVEIRDRWSDNGLDSPVHIDAAYGGYFATIFRTAESSDTSNGSSRNDERDNAADAVDSPWLKPLRLACEALPRTDSITVDPHKMGYAPYGAGALVIRHGFLRHLVSEGAAYALDTRGMAHEDLGKFILEGSKPGATSAAVLFNHRMLPLNRAGYGRHLLDLCRLAREFYSLVLQRQSDRTAPRAYRIMPLATPETNIVCLLVLPTTACRLSQVDEINALVARRFGVREVDGVQGYDYLISKTRLEANSAFVVEHPELQRLDQDHDAITCLRLVFMNRWVEGKTVQRQPFRDDFLSSLEAFVESILTAGDRPSETAPAIDRRTREVAMAGARDA